MHTLSPQHTSDGDKTDVICWNWDNSFRVDTVALNPTSNYDCSLPIKDMDGDGKVDILCKVGNQKGILHCAIEKANTPPAKMATPRLLLDKSTGMLRVEWTHGSDAENSVGDLSYELEITSADEKYLFRAFTKNLFSLASAGSWGESSVQVRVRAIDACGMKGKWSTPPRASEATPWVFPCRSSHALKGRVFKIGILNASKFRV